MLGAEQIDAGGDQRLDAVGDPVGAAVEVRLEQHAGGLLEEERIALRLLHEQRALLLARRRRRQQRGKLVALVGNRAARARSPPLAGCRRPKTDACRAARSARRRSGAAGSGGVRGPGSRSPRAARSSAHCTSSKIRTSGCASASSSAQRRPPRRSRRLRRFLGCAEQAKCDAEQLGDRVALAREPELLERLGGRVVVSDPCGRLHHRRDRPVCDALAVGQSAPGEDGRPLDTLSELGDQAGLADARVAEHGRQMRAPVAQRAVVVFWSSSSSGSRPTKGACRRRSRRVEQPLRAPRPDRLARA